MGRSTVVITCGVCRKQKTVFLSQYTYRKKRNPTGYTPVCSSRCRGILRTDIKLGRVKANVKKDMYVV
jgi:hypothetical protein